MKKIFVLTEVGNNIGWGHYIRCSSIVNQIKKINYNPKFVVKSEGITTNLDNVTMEDWMNKSWLEQNIKDELVIIDSYLAKEEIIYYVNSLAKNVIYIDDYDRLNYDSINVVNPAISIDKVKYINNNPDNVLYGPEYVILREEFLKFKQVKEINDKLDNVVIIMGGTDIQNLSIEIYKILSEKYLDISFRIITTPKNEKIYNKFISEKDNVYSSLSANEIISLFDNSNLVITAAGQTINELISLKRPFIAIRTVENQENNLFNVEKILGDNCTIDYIFQNSNEFRNNLIQKFDLLLDKDKRIELLDKLSDILIGTGAKYIVDRLLDTTINVRHACKSDINDVYLLSNSPEVRRYSLNSNIIEWEDHVVWFNRTIENPDVVFHVIENESTFLGQIRYSLENEVAIISISLKSEIRGKGLSKKIFEESCSKLFLQKREIKTIKAYVKENNIPSVKYFYKCGFTHVSTNDGVLLFELYKDE